MSTRMRSTRHRVLAGLALLLIAAAATVMGQDLAVGGTQTMAATATATATATAAQVPTELPLEPVATTTADAAIQEPLQVVPTGADSYVDNVAGAGAAVKAGVAAEATGVVTAAATCAACTAFELSSGYTPPWAITVKRALIFTAGVRSSPPTLPDAWTGNTQFNYSTGFGFLIAVEYSSTPVGPYSELLYVVGNFYPKCSPRLPLNSIQRIWVDLPATYDAGRRIWGIPKQLATFTWRDTTTTLGVTVTNSTGGVIFQTDTNNNAFDPARFIIPLLPKTLTAVHWPINDNAIRNVPVGAVPAYNVSDQALSKKKAITTSFQLSYTGTNLPLKTTERTSLYIDSRAMTGVTSPAVTLGLYGLRLPSGAKWSLPAPSLC